MPKAFAEFERICETLERHYRDIQNIEFTIQEGKLWMLQCRNGKRTTPAALKIAVDFAREGLITKEEAITRIEAAQLDQMLHPTIDPSAERNILTTGMPASPGAACGEIVFSPDDAEKLKALGKTVILVRTETSPEDIHGMHAAAGTLTARGGMTSHAAVVARGMGRPCVSGASALRINTELGTVSAGGVTLKKGDLITIDGSTGQVIRGPVAMRQPEPTGDFATLMEWADGVRRMKVRTNADTPNDAAQARKFGAEGIGLCRTEHMFFDATRIMAMREMIVSPDESGRRTALAKLLPMQRQDFVELFQIMAGLPVTIRLLDPPLHEFLPHYDEEITELAASLNMEASALRARLNNLSEQNPMLGHRGCRLAISFPEIAEMQARAIFEAAVEAGQKTGSPVVPEVMVPLIATKAELDIIKAIIDKVAKEVGSATGASISYHVGTMIELPRAALRAGDIAQTAEFFSFGTNDLTQTTYGLSRDDLARSSATTLPKAFFKPIPLFLSIRMVWANSSRSQRTEGGRRGPASSSAFAASMAAIQRRLSFARRSASTTCPVRHSGYRLRGWRLRRRLCGLKAWAGRRPRCNGLLAGLARAVTGHVTRCRKPARYTKASEQKRIAQLAIRADIVVKAG